MVAACLQFTPELSSATPEVRGSTANTASVIRKYGGFGMGEQELSELEQRHYARWCCGALLIMVGLAGLLAGLPRVGRTVKCVAVCGAWLSRDSTATGCD